ncbi:unnamed protein product [Vicia faba]|uniref:Uncharacterized protein n=1 Tax=Vicia faba TaxID=3906 RepID=A0AAV0ZTJ0_VICFA|nr:unnamed protein product [Vicia faba]
MPQLDKFTYLVMSEFAPICLSFLISLLVSLILLGILFVNPTRKLPPCKVFPMALGLLSCFGTPLAFSADTVPSPSDLFTYTSDMLEDSASSGHSSSTSAVNQPLPGEQAMPPALPVMQEAALPYPYQNNEIIGGGGGTVLNPSNGGFWGDSPLLLPMRFKWPGLKPKTYSRSRSISVRVPFRADADQHSAT